MISLINQLVEVYKMSRQFWQSISCFRSLKKKRTQNLTSPISECLMAQFSKKSGFPFGLLGQIKNRNNTAHVCILVSHL